MKLIGWICENYQWLFSGLGVFILSGLVWLIKYMIDNDCFSRDDKKEYKCPPCFEDMMETEKEDTE